MQSWGRHQAAALQIPVLADPQEDIEVVELAEQTLEEGEHVAPSQIGNSRGAATFCNKQAERNCPPAPWEASSSPDWAVKAHATGRVSPCR